MGNLIPWPVIDASSTLKADKMFESPESFFRPHLDGGTWTSVGDDGMR